MTFRTGQQFVINGECLVWVRGQGSLLTTVAPGDEPIPSNLKFLELGLTSEHVSIEWQFEHKDVRSDDFGETIPAEVLIGMSEVYIRMNLIYYDPFILNCCMSESLGGAVDTIQGPQGTILIPRPERMFSAYKPMGGGRMPLQPHNHYIQLLLTSPILQAPWLFETSYIARESTYKIGTNLDTVNLTWRSIPYRPIYSGTAESTTVISGFADLFPSQIMASGQLVANGYSQWLYSGGFTNSINYAEFNPNIG